MITVIASVIILVGIGNFTGYADKTFTINAANLSDVKVVAEDLTYNASSQKPNVNASAVAVNGQPITFTYSMDENSEYGNLPTFTEAGNYTVYYKVSAPNHNDNFGSFTVKVDKATVTYTVPTVKELTYDDAPQDLVTKGTAIGGEMQYALGTDSVTIPMDGWSVNVPQAVNAGTYYVWHKVVGDSNHNDVAPACVEVIIDKASQTSPNVSKTDETISEKNDGVISGVDSTMEYRKDGESNYTAITGTEVTGLADGTYFVRYKETDNFKASPETEVTIGVGRKLTVTVPQNQIGYTFTSSVSEFDWMSNFSVALEIHEGYTKTENFKYTIGGEEFNHRIENGTDEFAGAYADFVFGIEGIADITAPDAARKNTVQDKTK